MTPSILSDHNAPQLKTDGRQIPSNYTNSWRLRNTLLNDEWAKEEIKKRNTTSPGTKGKHNMKPLRYIVKVVLEGKIIALNAYI